MDWANEGFGGNESVVVSGGGSGVAEPVFNESEGASGGNPPRESVSIEVFSCR